jgi:hypothetical protein
VDGEYCGGGGGGAEYDGGGGRGGTAEEAGAELGRGRARGYGACGLWETASKRPACHAKFRQANCRTARRANFVT